MLCILPFMFGRTLVAWGLLMAASLAAVNAPWWLIDGAGAVVFASWPGWPSRAIATVFLVMMIVDLTHPAPWLIGAYLGWCQWVALLLWTRADLKPHLIARVT